MNTLDIVLIICFVPALIRGLSKGLLEQIVAIVSVIAGVWLAFKFSGALTPHLKEWFEVGETLLGVISFTVILVGVILVLFLLGKALSKMVKLAMMGWLDKLLGILAGFLVTALILGTVAVLFDTVNSKFTLVASEKLDASVMYGAMKDFGHFVFPYLKQLLLKN